MPNIVENLEPNGSNAMPQECRQLLKSERFAEHVIKGGKSAKLSCWPPQEGGRK
jgi:hypothetical protein